MATKSELAELNAEREDIAILKAAIKKGFDIRDWLTLKESAFKNMQRRACVFITDAELIKGKR